MCVTEEDKMKDYHKWMEAHRIPEKPGKAQTGGGDISRLTAALLPPHQGG